MSQDKEQIEFSNLLKKYIQKVSKEADAEIRQAIESELESRDIDPQKYQADLRSQIFVEIKDE